MGKGAFILFPYVVMGSPQNNSGAFFGVNNSRGWSSHSKQAANITMPGSMGNLTVGNIDLSFDNDVWDIPNFDGDAFPGAGGVL